MMGNPRIPEEHKDWERDVEYWQREIEDDIERTRRRKEIEYRIERTRRLQLQRGMCMVNTTIGVKQETGDRFRKGWTAMIGKLGRKISQSEVMDYLMDTAGWPKGKE